MAGIDEKLLELIGEVSGMLDLDELAIGLLVALQRLLPSDFVSINDVGPDPERVISLIEPPQPEDLYRAYGEFAFQNPLMARYMRTLDGRAYRFSDVIGEDDYHGLDLYKRVYGPMGVEHQMAFTLPATPGRVLAVALSRREPDYSDAERDLVDRARPHLIQVWRNAIEYTALRDEVAARPASGRLNDGVPIDALRGRGLTQREADVLALVARGRSNRDAGAILGISGRTVQKHLEHCYRKLEVPDRSAAAELVWRLVADRPEPPQADGAPRRGLDGRAPAS
ncbi:MAG TPA: helix-turn-helix transcriptional regulator [Solirubrobacterales bacterium]